MVSDPSEANRQSRSPDINTFEAVPPREDRKLGYFVSFDFTGDALFEIDRFRRKKGRDIRPLAVRETLE